MFAGDASPVHKIKAYFSIALMSMTLCHTDGIAQGHDWWAENVNWDGITHWSEYIRYGPRYLGPNAMPVPSLSDGSAGEGHYLSIQSDFHFSSGDQTQNLRVEGQITLLEGQISFDFSWIPVEFFQVSHEVKTERRVFHTFYDRKKAQGDLYFNTRVQLLQGNHAGLAARLGYRFPTSTLQGAARFTNTPGYYADVSGYWTPFDKEARSSWSILWMTGVYIWQTNLDEQFQNDALLAGTGLRKNWNDLRMELHLRAYFGYLNIGDQPIVLRWQWSYQWEKIGIVMHFEDGWQDFPFTSVGLGLVWRRQ